MSPSCSEAVGTSWQVQGAQEDREVGKVSYKEEETKCPERQTTATFQEKTVILSHTYTGGRGLDLNSFVKTVIQQQNILMYSNTKYKYIHP